MKNKYLILGAIALAGACTWFLFSKNSQPGWISSQNAAKNLQKKESGLGHIRHIFHNAKDIMPEAI